LIAGAGFTISPNPFDCADALPIEVIDNDANDSNSADGIIALNDVCAPESYMIIETTVPDGYFGDGAVHTEAVVAGATVTLVVLNTPDGGGNGIDLPPVCSVEVIDFNDPRFGNTDRQMLLFTMTDDHAVVSIEAYLLVNVTLEVLNDDLTGTGIFFSQGETKAFNDNSVSLLLAPSILDGSVSWGVIAKDGNGQISSTDVPCDPVASVVHGTIVF
jgi:hypothetical protein